jgi:hypothetical protein
MYRHYNPVHSDFLIHWTGKDIDTEYDIAWANEHSSKTKPALIALYLERLKYILKYGLWMTKNPEDEYLEIADEKIKRPYTARTCFTELKLSSARAHAADYGRLGIGFKRFFLFNRLGAPMTYYQHDRKNWFFPPYFSNSSGYALDDYFACFLKRMTMKAEDGTLQYKYYDESEWRIIYSDEIKNKLRGLNIDTYSNCFLKPCDINDTQFQEYINQNGRVKPEYLIPINDRWFCMIIYPSLAVKVEAEANEEIRSLLENLKPIRPTNVKVEKHKNHAPLEQYSKPIEIDLDACRNF